MNHEKPGSGGNSSIWDRYLDERPNDVPAGAPLHGPSEEAVKAAQEKEYERNTDSRERFLNERPNELGGGQMYAPSEEAVKAAQERQYEAMREERERYLSELPNDVPGVAYEDPDKYRKETTGTTSPEVAKAVTEASKFDFNPKGIDQAVDQMVNDPSAVQKMLELRMQRTADFMEGVGDYNKETIASDVNFILNLANKGFDFSNFKIDLNTDLGGDPKVVDFPGMLSWYKKGLERMQDKGRNTKVELTPTPDVPVTEMEASEALQYVADRYEQDHQTN